MIRSSKGPDPPRAVPALQEDDPPFDRRRLLEDETMRFVPEDLLAAWRMDGMGAEMGAELDDRDLAPGVESYRKLAELVSRLHRVGVPILAGTDAALFEETRWLVPGFSLHHELLLLVEAGLTPLDAIAAATSVPARVLGRPDTGSIEVGKQADLVLLSADPSLDIRNLRRIEAVVSRGKLLDREALDALLDRAQATLRSTSSRE